MQIFAAASGQRLHLGKTVLVWFGARPPAPLPAHIAGVRVVLAGTALGFSFSDGGAEPARGWDGRLEGARTRAAAAGRLGLSAMGRGIATAAYATSTFLYHAEFVDMPDDVLRAAEGEAAASVLLGGVRQPSAAGGAPRGAGLRVADARVLIGSPSYGGWGLLPLWEHVTARRAAWAGRLPAAAAAGRAWAVLARDALGRFSGAAAGLQLLSAPARRLAAAVLELPSPSLPVPVGGAPSPAGARAAAGAPLLWLLGPAWDPSTLDGRALERAGVRTVGQLHRFLHAPPPLAVAFAPVMPVLRRAASALPPGWLEAAGVGMQQLVGCAPPRPDWVAAALVAARYPGGGRGRLLALELATVRQVTTALLGGTFAARDRRLEAFAGAAMEGAGAPPGGGPVPDAAAVRRIFRRVWGLPLDNRAKEIWWVLVYGAAASWVPCLCGAPRRGRSHFFWGCPIAQAVVAEVQRCLPPVAGFVSRVHMWLVAAPPGQFGDAWLVVALAALAAMDHARRVQVRRRLSPGGAGASVVGLSRRAVTFFWARLAEFCSLGLAPAAWRSQPCAFFCWVPDRAGPSVGAWRITRPP